MWSPRSPSQGQHRMMERRPPDGTGDPGPGPGGTLMSTHGHGGRHLSEGELPKWLCSMTACQGPGG